MMWLANDGTMWPKMIPVRPTPSSRAAITKSSSRRLRNRPRTSRASPVQPISDRITVIAKYLANGPQLPGSAADNAIHSGNVGTDMMNSMIRWMMLSTRPPT